MTFFEAGQPLGLSKGSIRAILALLVALPFVVIALTSNIQITGDQYIGVLMAVLTAYFVTKAAKAD